VKIGVFSVRKLFVFIFCFLSISASAFGAGSDSNSSSSSASGGESSYGGGGGEGPTTKPDPLRKVKRLIYQERYSEAYNLLGALITPEIEDDRQNLMGFTARKSGDYSTAKKHYAAALKLSPKHVGALEYQGELFIALGDLDSAAQNLEKIKSICWLYCKEKKMLTDALKKARAN
jgi:tetratricopeptide (TPR) repeat protein